MASIFSKHALQALKGSDSGPSTGPLQVTQDAASVNGIGHLHSPELGFYDPDPMWEHVEVDGARWNKSYPFQLLIVSRDPGGGYSPDTAYGSFTLPIPPQAISISTPYAISTSVTLGGIIEEHNGAPLRNISFRGTTGVVPLKGTGTVLGQRNAAAGIFAGTVSAATAVASNAKTLAGTGYETPNLVDESEEALRGTGYYQFMLLQQFLESYVAIKKTDRGRDLRLALAIWKEQAVYLVTPMALNVDRSAESPWEYSYTLAFRAWRRIRLSAGRSAVEAFQSVARDPHAMAQVLNKVQAARRVLQSAKDVLLAVNADVEKLLLEPIRETVLFCKDALGVAATAADLPSALVGSLKAAAAEASALPETIRAGGRRIDAEFQQSLRDLGVKSGKAETRGGDQVGEQSQGLGSGADEPNRAFDRPEDNFAAMEQIRVSDLNLPPSVQRKILEERRRVQRMTRLDFEVMRDSFLDFSASFADAVGAGSSSYNSTYARSRAGAVRRSPTQDDFEVLFALNETVMELNRLAASSDIDREGLTTMEAVAGMASASGIAFRVPASKFAVPFPYGSTLEQLAAQYLGDPDRWMEIATLNGLRPPYVDEVGAELPLLVNGSGNTVTVATAENLYIGQPVWISSSSASRTKRRITGIDKVASDNVVLTLDGDPDLSRYDTLAGAKLSHFLPDTVNSQMLIYIPSDAEADDEYRTKAIPGIDEFDDLIRIGGVDLLLTQNGDLAVTPDGDCRLAIGLTNLIQRIRTAMATPRGSMIRHPDYGLGLVAGESTADMDVKQVLSDLQGLVRSDPAFSGISGVSVLKQGPVLRVSMSVSITGTGQVIPVTVDVRR